MNNKGTILIVEDCKDIKIGNFHNFITDEGYEVEYAETLKEADERLTNLIKLNILDGIILDLSFPVDADDRSDTTDNIPNGAYLLNKYINKLRFKNIPVIINSTSEEDYKKKYLSKIDLSNIPTYNVSTESNILSNSSGNQIKSIMDLFHARTELRNIASKVIKDNKLYTGKSIITKANGNLTYSRYDGD